MKALKGLLQSLSIQPGLTILFEGKTQEFSFVTQDWGLFLRFLAGFMGIFVGLFEGFRRAFQPLMGVFGGFTALLTGLKLSV